MYSVHSDNTHASHAEDVLKVLEKQAYSVSSQDSTSSTQETPQSHQSPTQTDSNNEDTSATSSKSPPGQTIVPLRGYKRAMVKSMTQAAAIPHFHLCDELDMRAVLAWRKAVKEDSVLQGVHLTFLPIMVKVYMKYTNVWALTSGLFTMSYALCRHKTFLCLCCATGMQAVGLMCCCSSICYKRYL